MWSDFVHSVGRLPALLGRRPTSIVCPDQGEYLDAEHYSYPLMSTLSRVGGRITNSLSEPVRENACRTQYVRAHDGTPVPLRFRQTGCELTAAAAAAARRGQARPGRTRADQDRVQLASNGVTEECRAVMQYLVLILVTKLEQGTSRRRLAVTLPGWDRGLDVHFNFLPVSRDSLEDA